MPERPKFLSYQNKKTFPSSNYQSFQFVKKKKKQARNNDEEKEN